MKKMLSFLSYVLVAAAAVLTTLTVQLVTGDPGQSKLDQILAVIDSRFIGEADLSAVEDAAADAMMEAIGDRWSYYISADEYQAYVERMNNAYVGIGITISVREDGTGFDILQVTEGGPAEEAGLLAGDILVSVEGQSVAEAGTDSTRDLIRGEEGTFVALQILRDGQSMDFSVERRTIQTVVASGELLPGDVGLVTVANFDSRCADETIAAVEQLLSQGARYLIFDVRYNPGGYKSELVEVLDYLLPEGPLFRSLDYRGVEIVDSSDASFLDVPMAVLVNGSSYSAAEFFAAAIREYEAGIVVGTQTTGKGHFQNTFRLSDGSAVVISTGKYFTPNGVSLADVGGLVPDVVIEVESGVASQIYAGTLDPMEDPQILAAIAALTGA